MVPIFLLPATLLLKCDNTNKETTIFVHAFSDRNAGQYDWLNHCSAVQVFEHVGQEM